MEIKDLVMHDGALHIRHISANIADIFECVLADADILIPDDEREGDEDEAALYGDTYSDFEDGITEELAKIVAGHRANGVDITAAKETIYASFVELLTNHQFAIPGNKDEIFQSMDDQIASLLGTIAKYPDLPVNTWTY